MAAAVGSPQALAWPGFVCQAAGAMQGWGLGVQGALRSGWGSRDLGAAQGQQVVEMKGSWLFRIPAPTSISSKVDSVPGGRGSVLASTKSYVFPFHMKKCFPTTFSPLGLRLSQDVRDSGESMWVPGGLFQAGLAACALKQPLDSAGSRGRLRKRPGFPKASGLCGGLPWPTRLAAEVSPLEHLPRVGTIAAAG